MEGRTTVSAAGGKRRRAPHIGPERRRPGVLDAALKLFLERGYEGSSMEAIAAAAGVTKPVVYDCFPGKDTLFNALLEREEERILAEITGAFAGADVADPQRTLERGFTAFLRAVAASPDVYRLIFLGEGGGNAALARRIQRGREGQVEALGTLAKSWLGDAGSPVGEPDRLATLLGEILVGFAEAGARSILGAAAAWDAEDLGRRLGELAAATAAAATRTPA